MAVNDPVSSYALTIGAGSGSSSIYSDGNITVSTISSPCCSHPAGCLCAACYIPSPVIVNPPLSGYWYYPSTRSEKPEDTIARAAREIAAAAKQVQESAGALGIDIDTRAIRKAVYKKVAEALGD